MSIDGTKVLGRVAIAAALSFAMAVGVVSVASAVGTTPNTITVGTAPGAGSVRGSYTPVATATSGDKVVSTLASTSKGCSLSGGKVTFTAAGICLVDFNDAGNATFAAASQVQQSITVYSANTITASTPPAAAGVNGSYTPSASATSHDQVIITLDHASTGCALGAGKVAFTRTGTCRVDFNDSGNGAFAAASQVQQSIRVYAANTITASKPPTGGSLGASYTPSASATSGDHVVITLDSSSTGCSFSAGKVTFTTPGICRVDFNDPGNGAFATATQVQQSIDVGKTQTALKLTSTIGIYGSNLTLTSSGGSGSGAVTYAVTSGGTAGCSISGGTLSATHAGACTVTVTKASDSIYFTASSKATTVTIAKAVQATLVLTSKKGTVGSALVLTSSGGSGSGAVTYTVTSGGTAGCSISGGLLRATSAGVCTVRVTKAADTNYLASSSSATTVAFAHKAITGPRISSFSGRPALIGKTVIFTIRGTGFAGVIVRSSNHHTTIRMVHHSARFLQFRVTVSKAQTRTGVAKLVISNRYGRVVVGYSMTRSR